MTKKHILIGSGAILLVVIISIATFFIFKAFSFPPDSLTKTQEYVNDAHGFSLAIPVSVIPIIQNDEAGYTDILFLEHTDYRNLLKDPDFGQNPLVRARASNADGFMLTKSPWIGGEDLSFIETYLTRPAGGPQGTQFSVVIKALREVGDPEENPIVVYTTQIQSVPQAEHTGVLFIRSGALYELTSLRRDNPLSEELLQAIAETFKETRFVTEENARVYVDRAYGFRFTLPRTFSEGSYTDGVYAYSKYFANENTEDEYHSLGPSDIFLTISISRDETVINNAEAQAEQERMDAIIRNPRELLVDGESATQRTIDRTHTTQGEPGCSIGTYFMKDGHSHSIHLFSSGGCEIVEKFREEYDQVVSTFRY